MFGNRSIFTGDKCTRINTACQFRCDGRAHHDREGIGFTDRLQLFFDHLRDQPITRCEAFGKINSKVVVKAQVFAGGRGKTQFMNWSLNYGTPTLAVPASTLGVGAIYIPNENTLVTALLTSATECVNNNCFDDLEDNGGAAIGSVAWFSKCWEI